MAATLRASIEGLAIVEKARCKKGWNRTSQKWADLAVTSKATLRRFWARVPIRSETFRDICLAIGIEEWESVIAIEIESNLEKKANVPKPKKHGIIEIEFDLEAIDPQQLYAILSKLSEIGNPEMRIVDVTEGSIKFLLEGSQEDFERLYLLLNSGEIENLLGVPVKAVSTVNKSELAQWVQENGGTALQLCDVDFSSTSLHRVDLRRADLRRANLYKADLSDAVLIGTNLNGANLNSANLNGANLFGANLHGPNLRRANLRTAVLVDSNLFKANLHAANMFRVNLTGTSLREANLFKTNLCQANMLGADLRRVNLREADLLDAYLLGAYLHKADLREANLREANLYGAELSEARVRNALFGTGIGLSEAEKKDLKDRGAIFDDYPEDFSFRPNFGPNPSLNPNFNLGPRADSDPGDSQTG